MHLTRLIAFATLLLPLFTYAKVDIVAKHKHYQVDASSKSTLLAAVNNASPIRENGEVFHGHTAWNIQWRFWWQSNQQQCRLNKVDVSLVITLTMPKLIKGEKQIQQVWDNWYPNLLNHEQGHIDLATITAKDIEQSLLAMPAQSNCKKVEQAANKLAQQKMAELSKASERYDNKTNHGETQGAWLYTHIR